MIQKLLQNLWAKVEKEFWSLSQNNFTQLVFFLLILLLPIQLGKHFWPFFSFVFGQRVDYLSPTLYVTDILVFLLFFPSLLQKKIRLHPFYLLSIVAFAISIYLSQNPLAGWYMLLKYIEMSYVVWFIAVQKKPQHSLMGIFLSLSILFESILAIAQFAHQGSLNGVFYFFGERAFSGDTPGIANMSIHGQLVLRPYGTFPHPNVLAGFLLLGMILAWTFLKNKKNIYIHLLLWVTLILGTSALLLSFSRVAILFWGITLVGWTFISLQKRTIRFKKVLPFLFGIFMFVASFGSFFFYRFFPNAFGESYTVRLQLMQIAFSLFTHSPLFGIGPNNFVVSLPSSLSFLQPVHNIFLLLLTETGIVGFSFFLIFSILLLRKVQRFWTTSSLLQGFSLCLLAIFVLGSFDHYFFTLQQGQLLLAIAVGLILRQTKEIA